MLVTKVLGDCPGCSQVNKFGNVSVSATYLLQGCFCCKFRREIPLPPVRKKILYIDQYFLSIAFKKNNKKFDNILSLIEELVDKQLLIAPYSSVHEEETSLFEGKSDSLLKFIKNTARGHKFRPSYEIQRKQILTAFKKFLDGEASKYLAAQDEAFEQNIHVWEDYFWIDVDFNNYDSKTKLLLKNRAVSELSAAFEEWRTTPNTFEESLAVEFQAAGDSYLNSYIAYIRTIAERGPIAALNSPINSMIVEHLFNQFDDFIKPENRVENIKKFFKSEHFYQAPYQSLSCRMFAALRSLAKQGAYTNEKKKIEKLSGVFGDVEHIATYAPYCDVLITDNSMAEFIKNPQIGLNQYRDLKIFSSNTFEELTMWLTQIKSTISTEHSDAVKMVYGSKVSE